MPGEKCPWGALRKKLCELCAFVRDFHARDRNPNMDIFFWLAVITLIGMLAFGIEGVRGAGRIEWLDNVSPIQESTLPSVSIIIPALNEEENIRAALLSLLNLDYEPLEIIVLNDRSTDRTGAILDEMSERHSRLKVIHINELPEGWLGKNNALFRGAQEAQGDYLLFSDADVIMEPSTLKRAIGYAREHSLDHLTLFFKAILPSSVLQMVVIELGVGLVSYLRPWKASDPSSQSFIGVGAFNLVKAKSYWQSGGHKTIRLCPLDDLKLGQSLKRSGFRQDCLYGYHFVSVKWYGSLKEMTQGLLKNTFAALNYSFGRLCFFTFLQILISIWPVWALFFTATPARAANLAIVLLTGLFYLSAALKSGISPKHILWFPLTPYIRIYMTWKAVLLTLITGGIDWRGTFYSLKELKENDFP